MILTDSQGRPVEYPAPPTAGAPIDDVITFLRAHAAAADRVAALASAAFDRRFRRAARSSRP